MIRNTILALAALCLAAPSVAQPADAPPDAETLEAFAAEVNEAIVACFYHTLDEEGRATQAELTGRGIIFSDVAPEAVRDLANVEALGGARFTQWSVPDAVMWVIAYTQAPACRIMVAETRLAQPSRDGVERQLIGSGLWTRDEAQSTTVEGIRRQIFFFAEDDAPNRLLLSLTGPVAIERNGDGLQMMVSLAALPRDQAQAPAPQPRPPEQQEDSR